METLDSDVPGGPEKPAGPQRRKHRTSTARTDFQAAAWGILFGLRSLVVTVVIAAIVVMPVILVDSASDFEVRALFESTTWSWLLMNGSAPRLGAATFTLLPWGLVVIPWILNFFAARALARRFSHEKRLIAVSTSLLFITYIAAEVCAAAFVDSINVSYSAWATFGVAILVNGTAVVAGVLSIAHFPIRIPELLRFIVVRGVAAALALLGIGALLVALLLVANFSDVLFLYNQLDPGYSGFLAITVLSLGYLPVLFAWAVAYLAGAGFTIGPDVMISPFIPVTAPTQLPPFPPLAVLPETAGAVSWLLPMVIICVGVAWGVGVSLHMSRETVLIRLVIAVGIGVVAAIVIMGLSLLAVGNLGDVRLVNLGPDPTLVGSLVWLLLTVGMIPVAVVPARFFTRKRPVSISVVSGVPE